MTKTIKKIVVKDGCEKECKDQICVFNQIFYSKDIAEVVFRGTFKQCQKEANRLFGGTNKTMQHCWYSGGHACESEYINEKGYLVKGNQNSSNYCFIAKVNTDAFISYEKVTPKTTEDLIKEDKKTFRSSMLSYIIKKPPCKVE